MQIPMPDVAANANELVFETPDVDDDDYDEKTEPITGPANDHIIQEPLQPIKSFQQFAGHIFEPNEVREPEIYTSTTQREAQFESPLQRYRRLQLEINELIEQLNDIASAKKSSNDPTSDVVNQMTKNMSDTFSALKEFRNNPALAALFGEAHSNSQESVASDYLFKCLQQFQAQKNNGGGDDSSQAVFTLYHNGDATKSARLSEVQERIERLETIIGNQQQNPDAGRGDMISAIEYLTRRMDLLSDQNQLSIVLRRSKKLKEELSRLKRPQDIEHQITRSKEGKISQMFEMMTRWDHSAQQLPTVIERLQSIKNLHEASASIVNKVETLNSQQQMIGETLEENKDLLKNVQQTLAENADQIVQNVRSIEERIALLQQKLQ